MAAYKDPRPSRKAETRRVRDETKPKDKPKRVPAKPEPAQKPVYTDWAMI
jgi:hypothetical protein